MTVTDAASGRVSAGRGRSDAPRPREPRQERLRDVATQLAIGLAVFGCYLLITHGLHPKRSVALAHARELADAERWLGIDVEGTLDRWLAPHPLLGAFAAWEYALTYIVTTFGVLVWVYLRRPSAYRWARDLLAGSTLLALAVFALWPAAPPRFLPGYPDVVAQHHPILSWGGGVVSAGADQLAAMPSLHIGWAVWVTLVTLHPAVRSSRIGPGAVTLSGLHLALTTWVVLATGNHFVLDVAGGVLVVAAPAALLRQRAARSRRWQRVAAPDAFFHYVETPTVPQHVGGVAILDVSGLPDGQPDLERFRSLLAERLPRLPRLGNRLEPARGWRGPRWVPADRVDLDRHLVEYTLPPPGGRGALAGYVARIAEQPLPLDVPPWQLHVVRGVGPGEIAAIAVMHHAVADGLGVVDILRQLFDPALPAAPVPDRVGPRLPARVALAALGVLQLAREGKAPHTGLTGKVGPARGYRMVALPLTDVRRIASAAGVRITDVMLALLGEVLAEIRAARHMSASGSTLRVAVPVTLRPPAPPGTGRTAVPGNLTAALRLDVPVDLRSALDRLVTVARWAGPRRRSARPFGATAVMRGLGLLPPPVHRWASRAIYNSAFFGAIATNMPGPDTQLWLAGAPMRDVYPIVPLASGVPVSMGALGWNGWFCLAVLYDPEALPELDSAREAFRRAFTRLDAAVRATRRLPGATPGDERLEAAS